jgi:hypothetical protein
MEQLKAEQLKAAIENLKQGDITDAMEILNQQFEEAVFNELDVEIAEWDKLKNRRCTYFGRDGWKPGFVVQSIRQHGETFHEVKGDNGEHCTALRDWKVKPDATY